MLNRANFKIASWSLIDAVSAPFFTFLLLPILNYQFGLVGYGSYALLLAAVTMLGFTGLGVNLTIIKPLAQSTNQANLEVIENLLGTALIFNLASTIIFCTFIAFFWAFAPSWVSNFSWFSLIDYKLLAYLFAMLITTQLDLVASSALKGLQFFSHSSKLEILLRSTGFVVLALVAVTQKDIYLVFLFQIIINIVNISARLLFIKKLTNIAIVHLKFVKETAVDLFKNGRWMTLQFAAWAIYASADKLAIGAVFGAKEAGIYSILIQFSMLLQLLVNGLFSAIYPKFSKENRVITPRITNIMIGAVLILVIPYALTLFFLKSYIFIYFHIDSSYTSVFYGLLLSTSVMSLNIPFFYIIFAGKDLKKLTIYFLVSIFFYAVLIYPFMINYAILGVVIAKLIAAVLFMIFIRLKFLNYKKAVKI
jgi:O-antigen/teichoic acid export membrane protein